MIMKDEIEKLSPPKESFAIKYGLAIAAACCAEIATYPLDVTKTRMQIAGEMSKGSPGANLKCGMFQTGLCVIKNEGMMGLWRGISPALYRHLLYAGIRLALYEKMREDVFGRDADGTFLMHKAALTGLIVGGVAQFSANPFDLVKVQLQMEGRRKLEGKTPRVTGVFEALSKIWNEAGVRGLWRGWASNAQRGALVNLGDIMTYDSGKRFLLQKTSLQDGVILHMISSLMSGFSATLMATPSEVLTTRLMNQPTVNGKGCYYKNTMDCLYKTVSNEGFFALYKGFIPLWMKLGPASFIFWVAFERFRATLGMSSF